MLPLLLAGAGLVGAAFANSLHPDTRIKRELDKAFDPGSGLSPAERQQAHKTAMEINGNRYKNESFADVQRAEIDYVVQQKKGYEQICTKLDTALKNNAISKEQYQALSAQYKAAIEEMDNWLNK